MPVQVGHGKHGCLRSDGDLPFTGVGLTQLLVQPGHLAGPRVRLGGHALLTLGELTGQLARSARLDEGRDILGPLSGLAGRPRWLVFLLS